MVQSPSWAANWFATSQEIPRNSRNPKVHYRTHKRLPPVSILAQSNPVHTPTSHLLEIHPNIIHPSTPMFPQWSLSLRFPHQDPIHSPLLTHMRHMPSPSHSSSPNILTGIKTFNILDKRYPKCQCISKRHKRQLKRSTGKRMNWQLSGYVSSDWFEISTELIASWYSSSWLGFKNNQLASSLRSHFG